MAEPLWNAPRTGRNVSHFSEKGVPLPALQRFPEEVTDALQPSATSYLFSQVLQRVNSSPGSRNYTLSAWHSQAYSNSSQCQELASYYFVFNDWSKWIIKRRDLSDLEGTLKTSRWRHFRSGSEAVGSVGGGAAVLRRVLALAGRGLRASWRKVSYLAWKLYGQGEEECLSGFSCEEALRLPN
uniref:RAD52 motif containing 1 n=1 Tax=Molossus molossus TaxID=27622 RepID=A0A7J8D1C6_MOLMO|nr:RAD52 motif containing 1 [Molossus molossus]